MQLEIMQLEIIFLISTECSSVKVGASESGSSGSTPGSSGKKTTFVPLFSSEGQQRTVAMLPGT